MKDVITYLKDDIWSIKTNHLSYQENRQPIQRRVAKQWVSAIRRDIEGLESGKYRYTINDLMDAQRFENDNLELCEKLFHDMGIDQIGDYNDLCWAEKIDLFSHEIEVMKK